MTDVNELVFNYRHNRKLSFPEIQTTLDADHGIILSRNAIIGRYHRECLRRGIRPFYTGTPKKRVCDRVADPHTPPNWWMCKRCGIEWHEVIQGRNWRPRLCPEYKVGYNEEASPSS
jgi:hypothetical protein